MSIHITCCFNCVDRQQGCHSTCEEYKKQKKNHDEIRDQLRIESLQSNEVYSCTRGKK